MVSETKPSYYGEPDKPDLISQFENGLMTVDEVRGFLKGNVMKYLKRYRQKNGVKDLNKATEYLHRLIAFETANEAQDDDIIRTLKNYANGGIPDVRI